MFKLHDAFLTSGVFNEALIKRFKESYNFHDGARLWMIPGHIIYTVGDSTIYTCDARPLDLLSPSEPCTGELVTAQYPTFDIFFRSQYQSPKMYIVWVNGDIQVFEYRQMLYEWARVGYFNLNITSPNSSNDRRTKIAKALVSPHLNAIYWSEKNSDSDMSYNLQRRTLPVHGVREITQSAVGSLQVLLINCPDFEMFGIADNVFIVPKLPNSVNLYLIITSRCHLWLFDITGKCLWRGIIVDQPMDFINLCMKAVGLWTQHGSVKSCRSLDTRTKMMYLFYNSTLLSILPNGEIHEKTEFELSLNHSLEYYILQNVLCVVSKENFTIFDLKSGKIAQTINLTEYPPRKSLYHESDLPLIGFYTESTMFMLQYESLKNILSSNAPCFVQLMNLMMHENVHLFALMRDIVYNRISDTDTLEPLPRIPYNAVQGKALLLALIQLCREKGIDDKNFPFSAKDREALLEDQEDISPNTNLKKILEPLVDSYCKLEQAKKKLQT